MTARYNEIMSPPPETAAVLKSATSRSAGSGGPSGDPPETGPVARVYVQLKARSLSRAFDYRVPADLAGAVRTGSVVLVPFSHRKVLGVVAGVGEASESPVARLVDVEQVVDFPPLPAALLDLALWVSEYYYCSPAAALSLVLPPGGLPPLVRETDHNGSLMYRLREAPLRPRSVKFVRVSRRDVRVEAGKSQPQRRVLEALTDLGEMPLAELLRRARVSDSPVRTLAQTGLVEIFKRQVRRSSLRYYGSRADPAASGLTQPLVLNQAQQEALGAIEARLDAHGTAAGSCPLLLRGVPGAGKTEVYIRAMEAAISRGGQAIMLVPEISLTHQAVNRLQKRFGTRVGIYHSALAAGERYDEYARIRSGEVDVVIGPRSALFAPLPDLKLIVVDEENDASFKQENEPHYDARRAALERARREGAALVYGSATPSVECYFSVREHYKLPDRATGAAMPSVEIVDMLQENVMIFSRRLLDELDSTLAGGDKAILLLNRRGYAGFLQCGQCGYVWQCRNCEVSLTIHSRARRLCCHHCGAATPMPDICPECGAAELRRWGIGTERIEEELCRRFPEAPVFRLDADTASGYGEGPRILREFGRPGAAVLLGTQMVAKGHHFPDVTLAAVINADLALQFPEFRAEEQTYALLTQLAGRSGRAGSPGRVLIQTWNAGIECIRMAASQATEEFYRSELERRRRLGYPPYSRLINIICLSKTEGKPGQAVEFLKQKLPPAGGQILGPADLFRLQGWWRSHILVKTDSTEKTLKAFQPVLERYRGPFTKRGVRIIVDVDPQRLS